MLNIILTVLLLSNAATLLAAFLLWWHCYRQAHYHRSVEVRLARVEAEQKNTMSPTEVRAIYSQLAELNGRMGTVTDLMHGIQEHLLERDT